MAEFLAESGLKAELSRGLALLASLYKISSIYKLRHLTTCACLSSLKRYLKLERLQKSQNGYHSITKRASLTSLIKTSDHIDLRTLMNGWKSIEDLVERKQLLEDDRQPNFKMQATEEHVEANYMQHSGNGEEEEEMEEVLSEEVIEEEVILISQEETTSTNVINRSFTC
eukprot:g71410.t1